MAVAEDLGFASAWFYDSQMLYSDVYATMTLVAEHTKRIKIGTGIVVPSNRIAPVTAHSIATINEMAPGRTMLGIGTGFTGRFMMGLPPVRLGDLREHVRICRALLSGEEVLYREGKRERWIRFMHPDRSYINIKESIPIVIAAQGPKALEVAGEIGDGWMAPASGVEASKTSRRLNRRPNARVAYRTSPPRCLRRPACSSRANRSRRPACSARWVRWRRWRCTRFGNHPRSPRSFHHLCSRFLNNIVTNMSANSTYPPIAGI